MIVVFLKFVLLFCWFCFVLVGWKIEQLETERMFNNVILLNCLMERRVIGYFNSCARQVAIHLRCTFDMLVFVN